MSEELKNHALSDDELEDVNGGFGIGPILKDGTGKKPGFRGRFGLNNNAQEEAENESRVY
ncbi:MAG: hypothetical protein Q4E35_07195 [Eubacteriales bacterium]|nr:hypothetical protein [Eubacteriales bacterium]